MGRHRRSGAAPAAEGYAADGDRRHRGARPKKRGAPVRTGLLGASAAVAVGAVAVASGLLPGGDTYTVGSAGSGETRSHSQPQSQQAPELTTQGGASATPSDRSSSPTASASKGAGTGAAGKSASPSAKASAKPSPTPSKTTASPTPKKPSPQPSKTVRTAKPKLKPKPAPTTEKPVVRTEAPAPVSRDAATAAEVVRLVNQERAKVGCVPVRSDAELAELADAFSEDMARRGFFDHTDPDGATPWDRAAKAGISGMGGENIARGQVDAAAVMSSWMNSDGHRANILNCDYKSLGVGVHFADGGPWWTQDFGF
ncbi:CAP domain-containing protein [Streptomyces sp. NPDC006551]|uniref:CAP domain-containing protein n=1 Tax=Streptomyces sp. NPDC006551 TaxID=3157178 RepID=UPI0033AEA859